MKAKNPFLKVLVGSCLLAAGFSGGFLFKQWRLSSTSAYQSAVIIEAGFEQQQKLHFVDKVEIYALGEGKSGDPVSALGEFPLHPYGGGVPILSKQTVEGKEADQLGVLFLRLPLIPVEYSALCHLPPYGLRFFEQEELVFETSVCWTCSNFQIPFRGEHTWCGFGSEGPVAMAFLKRLQHYIPLPAWAQEVDSKVEKAWLDDLEFPIPMDQN